VRITHARRNESSNSHVGTSDMTVCVRRPLRLAGLALRIGMMRVRRHVHVVDDGGRASGAVSTDEFHDRIRMPAILP
jgi:hypothetical protein